MPDRPARFFFERQFLVRHQLLGVDQALRGLAPGVVFPQVETVLVVGARAQEGHAFAVGRHAQVAHAGAGQRGFTVDAVQRQFFGHGGRGREGGQEKEERAHDVS